jgi:hypothetical protein
MPPKRNIDVPMPSNTLAVTRERKLVERAPIKRPSIRIPKIISRIFLSYASNNLPAIGVMTTTATKDAASIQDESSNDKFRSTINSGIAGSSIVSEDIATMPKPPNIASVIHGSKVLIYFLNVLLLLT